MIGSKDYFYVRNLQWKMYFSGNSFIKSLFYLENYLFSNYKIDDEIIISNLKIKWIYDQISQGKFSNEITKNLIELNDKKILDKILNLVELYSDIICINDEINLIEKFKTFSKKFNNLLSLSKSKNFQTSYLFQLIQLAYKNSLNINYDLLDEYFLDTNKSSIDIFETVFIEIFLKKKKKLKITKSYYLFKLLIRSIKK